MLYITILFGLRPSKSLTPANFLQFKHCL